VNVAHERQDTHGTRARRPGLFRFKVAGELLPTPASPGATAVDVGGGMGEFSDVMAAKGYAVTLIDLSESNVAHARGRGHTARRADLNEPLPFEDASFDAAGMLEVIEHVVNAELLLAEAVRVLRPGGYLVLSTPNAAWLPERVRSARGLPPSEEGYHYRFFTVTSLRKLLAREPLDVVAERFASPSVGLNKARRLLGRGTRGHTLVASSLAPLLAQTSFVLARKRA
jgi:2-polyprenyl-6-hydroxyphenyl methylase/3-demethylubiquinone-9 3-methyltransferase